MQSSKAQIFLSLQILRNVLFLLFLYSLNYVCTVYLFRTDMWPPSSNHGFDFIDSVFLKALCNNKEIR